MEEKKPNFSYSRLEQYVNCPYCYKLKYEDKKFIEGESIITLIGTLTHKISEEISLSLMEGKSPNYDELIDKYHHYNIPKKDPYDTEGGIFGLEILKQRFPEEYYKPSEKTGLSYFNKAQSFIQNIRRQEEFMLAHPELEIWDVEHPFRFEYGGNVMKGFIDRILKYKGQNRYIIHDIKTKDRPFDKQHATTPLQFVCYSLSLKNELKLDTEPDECYWDLVFIQEMQQAGTKGFIKRGCKKLDSLFTSISAKEFTPKPSPLCYWCPFSNTNPNVNDAGRNECPYYSHWTPENPSFTKMFEWAGMDMVEEHKALLSASNVPKKYGGFVL